MTDYVSAVEAAKLSGLSERTIRRWVKRGKLRAVRDGHAVRVPLSKLMDLCGRRSCHPADSGQVGHVDSGHSGPSHDGEQATGHDNSQDSLLTLVRELKTELVQTAAAASMWQARAEMLALQLEDARAQLALGAPTDAPESRPGGPERAESGRMVPRVHPAALRPLVAPGVGGPRRGLAWIIQRPR